MELPHGGGLVEEVESSGGDHGVEGAVLERQLLRGSFEPSDFPERAAPARASHRTCLPVYLVRLNFSGDTGSENSCPTSDISNPAGAGRTQEPDHFVLGGLVDPALKSGKVVKRRGDTPEPRHDVVEPSTCFRHVLQYMERCPSIGPCRSRVPAIARQPGGATCGVAGGSARRRPRRCSAPSAARCWDRRSEVVVPPRVRVPRPNPRRRAGTGHEGG